MGGNLGVPKLCVGGTEKVADVYAVCFLKT